MERVVVWLKSSTYIAWQLSRVRLKIESIQILHTIISSQRNNSVLSSLDDRHEFVTSHHLHETHISGYNLAHSEFRLVTHVTADWFLAVVWREAVHQCDTCKCLIISRKVDGFVSIPRLLPFLWNVVLLKESVGYTLYSLFIREIKHHVKVCTKITYISDIERWGVDRINA